MKNIGDPSKSVEQWLIQFAEDNEYEARHSFFPWNKALYRGRAWAFRTAAELVKRASE